MNACLAPLVSVDGKHVITVEGIGNTENPHPVQQRIAVGNGSQCGFCTPGIVMVRRDNPISAPFSGRFMSSTYADVIAEPLRIDAK